MKQLMIKVSQTGVFDVPVRGEPPPDLVWKFKKTSFGKVEHFDVKNDAHWDVGASQHFGFKKIAHDVLTPGCERGLQDHAHYSQRYASAQRIL